MTTATAHPDRRLIYPDRRLISSEDVQGTDVYGVGEEAIGDIDHLLIEKVSGRVSYAVMSFGGFLGLGHSHYPIPWSALKYDTALGGYRTGITESQLRDAPEFSDDSWEIVTGKLGRMSIMARPSTGTIAVLELGHDATTNRGHVLMPAIIMWLLGVPLVVIVLLYLIF
jgi:hypothetical protein